MQHARRYGLIFALIVASAIPAMAQQTGAGIVKVAVGSALILRDNQTVPVKAGQVVFETDTIRTGVDGRVGVTLKDNTRISLGPGSEVRLQRFAYAPADGNLALVLQFVRGVALRLGIHRKARA
jgi:hypothetical protein